MATYLLLKQLQSNSVPKFKINGWGQKLGWFTMISSHSVASLFCYGKINLVPVIQLNLIEVMITWKLRNKNPQAKPPTSKDL